MAERKEEIDAPLEIYRTASLAQEHAKRQEALNFIIYSILTEISLKPPPLCGTTRVRPKTTGKKTSIILEVLQTPLRKPNVPNRLGGENGRHNLSVSQSEARQGRVQIGSANIHSGPEVRTSSPRAFEKIVVRAPRSKHGLRSNRPNCRRTSRMRS
ncbi:hypothetical protein ACFW04_010411 [Cataglyphis niger]